MNDTKTKKPIKKPYILRRIIDVALTILLVGGVIYGYKAITSDFSDINRTNINSSEAEISSSSAVSNADSLIYVSEIAFNDDIHNGTLIAVNKETEFKGNQDNLVSMFDILSEDGTDSYSVMDANVKIKKDAAKGLNSMLKAFAKETKHKDIIITNGFRSVDEQKAIYDSAENKSIAAKPGFSDYHTGYSFDLGIASDDGTVSDFEGKDDYAWFEQNCYKYGFVLRFPDGKKEQTGYDYRPWVFRYVGKVHAYYMHENKLCLEEYLDMLRKYEYEKPHLTFSDKDNNEYEIYYKAVTDSDDTTMLAVPSEMDYTVSGNNSDGFIIAFRTNAEKKDDSSKSEESKKDDNSKSEESKKDDSSKSHEQ